RECKRDQGCIVSALVNTPSRVIDKEVFRYERDMALKFIIHFISDIHQPIHIGDLLHGDNGKGMTFNGRGNDLHRVWESAIPEKHIGGNAIRNATAWLDNLRTEIETSKFNDPSVKQGWT
ncbi:phospholipase C/P1 nuclease, partial [Tuber magnatum]